MQKPSKQRIKQYMKQLNFNERRFVQRFKSYLLDGSFQIPFGKDIILFQGSYVDYDRAMEDFRLTIDQIGYLIQLASYHNDGEVNHHEFAIVASFGRYDVLVGRMWQLTIQKEENSNEYK